LISEVMKRRKTKVINLGSVKIGGGNPVSIQSMLKVKTADTKKAIKEALALEEAGSEILRVAVKDIPDARAIKTIKKKINMPVVSDIHFDIRLAIESIKNGSDKVRINPGNIQDESDLKKVIKEAKNAGIPIRIGVNSGSIPREYRNLGLAEYAYRYIKLFERNSFRDIIISLKSSDVAETVAAYKKLAGLCDYPFHLGVTAAGPKEIGLVKSSIGIGALLLEGIGDTIRVSLTADPIDEVVAGKRILKSLGIRNFGPDIISCPTCGRCQVDLKKIVNELQDKLSTIGSTSSPSLEPSRAKSRGRYSLSAKRAATIALMGCEVNGPGEARDADIGIAFGKTSGVIFKKGKVVKKVTSKNAVKELVKISRIL